MHKNIKPIIGEKFGKLLVEGLIPTRKGKRKEAAYQCLCDCGNRKSILGCNLRAGRVSSCGCLMKTPPNKGKDRKLALTKRLFSSMASNGRNNLKGFNLKFVDFCDMISKDCFYCGQKPSNTIKDTGRHGLISNAELNYSGIDRKNNDLGYIKSNCVPCCKTCNFCKCSMSHDDFVKHIKKINQHLCQIK